MKSETMKWVAGIVLAILGLMIGNEIGLLIACVGAGIISE